MKLEKKLFLSFGILFFCLFLLFFFFSEELARSTAQVFILLCVFSLLALSVTWMIIKGITRPLRRLVLETEKIKAGDYNAIRLSDEKRSDEIGVLTRSFETMVEGLREREKIRSVLNKVVSKDVADEILKTSIQLGGEDRPLTIQFIDIRDFSGMSQRLTPQETITLLNTFMTKMTHVIEGEGGVVDKYIGDGIMSLYGAPVFYPDHALRALSAALIMIETLKKWNNERVENGLPCIEIGIGMHSGTVVVGNMGAEDRLNYTVLGSGVNLASRLCDAAHHGQILISEYTLNEPEVKEAFFVKELPPMIFKGFPEPIKIYEIVGFKWDT
jgi:adenylate cyclase